MSTTRISTLTVGLVAAVLLVGSAAMPAAAQRGPGGNIALRRAPSHPARARIVHGACLSQAQQTPHSRAHGPLPRIGLGSVRAVAIWIPGLNDKPEFHRHCVSRRTVIAGKFARRLVRQVDRARAPRPGVRSCGPIDATSVRLYVEFGRRPRGQMIYVSLSGGPCVFIAARGHRVAQLPDRTYALLRRLAPGQWKKPWGSAAR